MGNGDRDRGFSGNGTCNLLANFICHLHVCFIPREIRSRALPPGPGLCRVCFVISVEFDSFPFFVAVRNINRIRKSIWMDYCHTRTPTHTHTHPSRSIHTGIDFCSSIPPSLDSLEESQLTPLVVDLNLQLQLNISLIHFSPISYLFYLFFFFRPRPQVNSRSNLHRIPRGCQCWTRVYQSPGRVHVSTIHQICPILCWISSDPIHLWTKP